MKPERALLKYFFVYATLAISWLLSTFAWSFASSQTAQNDTLGHLINIAVFAAVSMLYWFIALQRHSQEKKTSTGRCYP